MGEPDHEQTAERLEEESAELEHHLREFEDEIKSTQTEWARKRADPRIPGAPPPNEGGEREPSEQQTPPW